ncbi:hypothetical protein BOTBODRAFT_269229 [Botryobasidium botryosum FD-172 SS1]|uniref:Uncharacterized protein n=1 Tax=Botryobasidium botryosum (strain FD-172 SS1) TaxID=930990 RepID=A0A067MK33_BOTB1|nr:hypothetical protein BOTBODRAFT_269229 [Botryobasidium botryosum FD-172 SS1]
MSLWNAEYLLVSSFCTFILISNSRHLINLHTRGSSKTILFTVEMTKCRKIGLPRYTISSPSFPPFSSRYPIHTWVASTVGIELSLHNL